MSLFTLTRFAQTRALLVSFLVAAAAFLAPGVQGATTPGSLTFSNMELSNPSGLSEPAISISAGGMMAITGLQWDFNPASFGTNFWTGAFGSTPKFQGLLDSQLQHPGKTIVGSGDADIDFGSTGTIHATTLLFFLNPHSKQTQLGVVAVSCPNAATATFTVSSCTRTIVDTAGTDRPWITSDGSHVYLSYHDAGNSSLIHLQRSDDDGVTWRNVADPIVAQGSLTADSTFNNTQGRLATDPLTHNVYDVYASGETGVLKAHTFTPNHIIVSRSIDMGKSWTANVVFTAPPGTSLANVFPTLTVDPSNGHLYAAWSDGQTVWLSTSSDQASHWSTPVAVNTAPAGFALLPAIAAYHGTVDVAYYATTDSNTLDPGAVWNTYMAQTTNDGASFTQSLVSSHPNHVGPVCVDGTACTTGTRNLLDLFEVAIDPLNRKAAIVYVDDTLATVPAPDFSCLPSQTTTCPLPQLELAQQH